MIRIIRGCCVSVLMLAASLSVGASGFDVVDDMGAHLSLAGPARRIVSLAPGATEMLFAAGAGPKLVATVAYSDEPAAARRVPRIGDSSAIDMERLLVLKPDVIVYWPGGGNPAQVAQLKHLGFVLYGQQVNRLADLAGSLQRLGLMAGTFPLAQRRAGQIQAQLSRLRAQYSKRSPVTALLETWNQPLYTVGGQQLMSDALAVCGAVNIFGDLPQLSPAVQMEAVLTRNPDLIIAAAPPGQGAQWLGAWRKFPSLKAVQSGNLLDFDDQALSRLGPSVLDATGNLCARIDAARARRRGALSRGNY